MNIFWPQPPDMNEYIKIGSKEYILLSKKVDTVWLTKEKIIKEYVPVPGPIEYRDVPSEVDTTEILKDYFAVRSYIDTIALDSIGFVKIDDKISKNMLESRNVFYQYHIPTVYETTIVKEKPRNAVYLGGGTMVGSSIYGGVLFDNKQKRIYGVQFGMIENGGEMKPAFGGSIYWKLNFNKKWQ